MNMIYLPSDCTPHYRLTITVVIPIQKDGKGKSMLKTEELVTSIEKLCQRKAVSILWNEHAVLGKIIEPKVVRTMHDTFSHVEVEVPAPLDFDRAALAQGLGQLWVNVYGEQLDTYIRCIRHYTMEEILQHC